MTDDNGGAGFGDRQSIVGAAGIDDKDFEGPVADGVEASFEIGRFVEGQNDNRYDLQLSIAV